MKVSINFINFNVTISNGSLPSVVVQMGCHDELLRIDGEYARLTKRQLSTLSQ